ncbi:ribonuclease R [Haloferula sp.]|uniref:ribonuclease R n=1 Tax=Haloferula sp. TaxID=2497595 RepID=UPI003C780F66
MSQASLPDRILELMRSSNYRPMNKSDLSRALKVPIHQRSLLRRELSALEKAGKIVLGNKNRYQTPSSTGDQLRGTVKFTPKGDAWFFPDQADTENKASGIDLEKNSRLYVPRRDTGNSLDGDRVLASLHQPRPDSKDFRRNRDAEPETRAKVENVIDRRSGKVVGAFHSAAKGKNSWVIADDPAMNGRVDVIGDNTARAGQMVVVAIDDYESVPPRGHVIEVLGWPDEAGVDILAIIHRNGIKTSFPDEVLSEARQFGDEVDPKEIKRREDWRDRLVITIDPGDAKDHDDAIWVSKTKNGWQLAVHIADVSHYVKPRTSLDKEAIERGNSTYLVDRVIPMLPVELSNGLCSLKPFADRLTKCAILDVNRQGKVIKSRFCDAVIHSRSKLSYEQAQTILDGKPAPKDSPQELVEMVKEAWAMASRMRKKRFDDGALDLEMPEVRVRLDDQGKADRIEKVIHTESHQLIEECMLAANESVARIIKMRNKPAIYRIHEEPEAARLLEYGETAKAFGYSFGDLTNKRHIQELLDAAKGKPDEHAIKIGLLKSLKRAAYSPDPLGHYGLSKSNYCHFTSPIRRYADLIIHRALQPFLDNAPKHPDKTFGQSELHDIARHISDTERASADSENESKNIKMLEYLDRCSKADKPVIFEGLITEVRSMGLMVEATEIGTRGVIKREDLPQGPWRFEQSQARLVGPGGRQFQMGQRIKLEVANIDHERRFVDFKISGEAVGTGGRSSRSNSNRRPSKTASKGNHDKDKSSTKGARSSKRPQKKAAKKAAKQHAKPLRHKRKKKA